MDRCSVWRCARGFGVGGRSACWWVPSVECGDRHLQACHLGPSGDHGLHNDGDTNFGIILQSATSEMVLRQNLLLACISDRRNPNSVKIINILTSQCLKALSSTLLTSLRISMIIAFHNVETLLKLFLAVSYGCFEIIAQLSWIYGHCYQAEGVRRYLEDMEDILKDFEKYSKAEDQEGKMPPGLFPPERES